MKAKELRKIKAFEMASRGIKQELIAQELGCSVRSIHRWLSESAPKLSEIVNFEDKSDIPEDNSGQIQTYRDLQLQTHRLLEDSLNLLQQTVNDEQELMRHRLKAVHLAAILYGQCVGSLNTAMMKVLAAGYEIHESPR